MQNDNQIKWRNAIWFYTPLVDKCAEEYFTRESECNKTIENDRRVRSIILIPPLSAVPFDLQQQQHDDADNNNASHRACAQCIHNHKSILAPIFSTAHFYSHTDTRTLFPLVDCADNRTRCVCVCGWMVYALAISCSLFWMINFLNGMHCFDLSIWCECDAFAEHFIIQILIHSIGSVIEVWWPTAWPQCTRPIRR